MIPSMPVPAFAFAQPYTSPRYLSTLKKRREVIHRMCAALEEYLAFDLDEQILHTKPSPRPRVTPEQLADATMQLETMEKQVAAVEKMIEGLPDELSAGLGALQNGLLGQHIETQRAHVQHLQDELDGKVFSVACSDCYQFLNVDGALTDGFSRDTFRGTKEECAEMAARHGWFMDGDEHKCPTCGETAHARGAQ